MSEVIDSLAKHLQERVNEAETRLVGLEAMLFDAHAEIDQLRKLLLTGLALHGGEAHSEKEWRAEVYATLGITTASAAARPAPQTPAR